MRKLEKPSLKSLAIGAASALSIGFAAHAQDGYPYGDKFANDPYATVTEADQAYVNIPGNEFQMIFTSSAYPEGKTVTIDPDDVMPINHPQTGQVTIVPRNRFLDMINAQLPNIPGFDFPPPKPGEGLGVKGTVVMFKHLVDPPIMDRKGQIMGGGHGLSQTEITDAVRRCLEHRNIPAPQ